jgi:SAM-dependent methyltransferase
MGATAGPPDRNLLGRLRAEEAEPFGGWDFSRLEGRMLEEPPPWDYGRIVRGALEDAASLLDMGTGGGEFLAGLAPLLPPKTCATEGWEPNVPVARSRLGPLGVEVRAAEDDGRLPFGDAEFDLVINRQASYEPEEVRRVLEPGGRFVTQQVGGRNLAGLNAVLEAPNPGIGMPGWDLAQARGALEGAGFEVRLAREAFPPARFADLGAVVYYLKAVPWQVPGFSVDGYAERLGELEARARAEGAITARGHRFLLDAVRSA